MDDTGWTWEALMNTPANVVDVVATRIAARNKAMKLRDILTAPKPGAN